MENLKKGIILKGVGGLYSVRLLAPESEEEPVIRCRARGAFRHNRETPLPGDRVEVLCEGEEQEPVIHRICPRQNSLIRPPLANLDFLFVTFASAAPTPILSTVDKLIAIAEYNRIEPLIVVTKSELNPEMADTLANLYQNAGFRTFEVSAKVDTGIAPLERFVAEELSHKIAAFAGASGIGKSTLMNRLFPGLSLSTFEISRKTERGRHTTRQVELFPLGDTPDCGYIADTPGFSLLDFERFDFFDKEALPETMREFRPYLGECRYTKCSHTKEDGCAVLQAVKEGKIAPSRHASYVELYETLRHKKKWD